MKEEIEKIKEMSNSEVLSRYGYLRIEANRYNQIGMFETSMKLQNEFRVYEAEILHRMVLAPSSEDKEESHE